MRGRVGFLAANDLLLFGTGGFAYGRVKQSDSYTVTGATPGAFVFGVAPFAFSCTVNVTCFTGSSSKTNTGWTAGAGAEWRFWQHWSVKAEYLYINLGSASVNAAAITVPAVPAGLVPASYRASFGDADYHIVRVGLNWHF